MTPHFLHQPNNPDPPYRESVFTNPHHLCPHPEWWSADDDESAEHEVTALVAAFVRALQPELVLEAGTAFGQTARLIAQVLADNGHGKLISLDIVEDRIVAARELCAGLPVEFLTVDAAKYEPPTPLDFIWMDSGQNRAGEIAHLRPYLAPGAIIGVHDTGPQHTVRQALEQLQGFNAIYLRTPRGVAFLEAI